MNKKIALYLLLFSVQVAQANPLLFAGARFAGHAAMRSRMGVTAGRVITKRFSVTGPRAGWAQKAQAWAKVQKGNLAARAKEIQQTAQGRFAATRAQAELKYAAARTQAQQRFAAAQANAKTRGEKLLLAAGGTIARNPHTTLGSATGAAFGGVVTDFGKERIMVEVQDEQGNITGTRTDYVRTWQSTKRTMQAMFISAFAGGMLMRNTSMLNSIKADTVWLRENVATKLDLSKAVNTLESAVTGVKDHMAKAIRVLSKRGGRRLDRMEGNLSGQIKGVNQQLGDAHAKLDKILDGQKIGFGKVADLWNKWLGK